MNSLDCIRDARLLCRCPNRKASRESSLIARLAVV